MTKFDRYIVSQLLVLFAFFLLILVMVYWINRAVVLFDQLIANGHSARVFLEFTTLSLPNLMRMVLPTAGFVAVLWSVNRLYAESELIVAQSAGFSPLRLARPVLIFGLILAAFYSLLAHFVVPASLAELSRREVEIQNDLTARLLREGTFVHPVSGVTFFVGKISEEGVLENVFLSDRRTEGQDTAYSARRALFRRDGDTARLILLDGMVQSLGEDRAAVVTTRFEDLTYDVSDFMRPGRAPRRDVREITSFELLTRDAALAQSVGKSEAALRLQLHERMAQTLATPAAVLLALSCLLIGGFSRFGLWRQIGLAVLLIVVLQTVDSSATGAARKSPEQPAGVYASAVLGLAIAGALFWLAAKPALFSRLRRRRERPA